MGQVARALLAAGFALAGTPALAAGLSHQNSGVTQDILYFGWDEHDATRKGYQLVTPLTATSSYEAWTAGTIDLSLRGAYILSDNNSAGAEGRYSGLSDTAFGLVYTMTEWAGVQPFLSVDLNLPTGGETLRGAEKNALMDPDLVWQIRFGEGFNYNLGGGVIVPISQRWTASAALGVNSRLAYVPDGDSGAEFDPGQQRSATVSFQYTDEQALLALSAVFTDERAAKLNGVRFFDPGDSLELNGEFAVALGETDTVSGALGYSHVRRNAFFDFLAGTLLEEQARGVGDAWTAQLALQRDFGVLRAEVNGAFLTRDANAYDAASDFFIPARTKWSVGLGASGAVSEQMTWSAGVSWGRLNQDGTAFVPAGRDFDTVTGSLSGTVRF